MNRFYEILITIEGEERENASRLVYRTKTPRPIYCYSAYCCELFDLLFRRNVAWILTSLHPERKKYAVGKLLKGLWAWVEAQGKLIISFADRLLYRLGVEITDWFASFLSEEWAGDLKELQHELTRDGEPGLAVFLQLLGASLVRVWAILALLLKELNASDDNLSVQPENIELKLTQQELHTLYCLA